MDAWEAFTLSLSYLPCLVLPYDRQSSRFYMDAFVGLREGIYSVSQIGLVKDIPYWRELGSLLLRVHLLLLLYSPLEATVLSWGTLIMIWQTGLWLQVRNRQQEQMRSRILRLCLHADVSSRKQETRNKTWLYRLKGTAMAGHLLHKAFTLWIPIYLKIKNQMQFSG